MAKEQTERQFPRQLSRDPTGKARRVMVYCWEQGGYNNFEEYRYLIYTGAHPMPSLLCKQRDPQLGTDLPSGGHIWRDSICTQFLDQYSQQQIR